MFEFTDIFDIIENNELILKITQKYSGDNEMIPFYYYDIIRKVDNVTVGKISIRISNNFHSYYNGHIGYEVSRNIVVMVMLIKQALWYLMLHNFTIWNLFI